MFQIHSLHLTYRNTSAACAPHPAPDGGIRLVPLIKGKGLLGRHVRYIKGHQAPVFKFKDKRSGQDSCGRADVVKSQIREMSHDLEVRVSSGFGNNHTGSATVSGAE